MELIRMVEKIPVIESSVNYWMVRTNGGKFYDQFINNKRVAMGSNYVNPSDILKMPKKKEDFFKSISPVIEEHTESERPGTTASQFYKFYYEIKKNDIVIIPSSSSTLLSVGRITDDTPSFFKFVSDEDTYDCDHVHTRTVEWITTKERSEFNPNFISLLFSHHAIVDASPYKDYINGVIYDYFIEDNTGHLIINVQSREIIKAKTLFYMFFELFDLTEEFIEVIDSNDINIRINLNSPGKVELISKNITKLSLVGLLIVMVAGGNFKSKSFEVGTDGLLKPILKFVNEKDERKARVQLINEAMNELNIKEPKEVVKILQEARIAQK